MGALSPCVNFFVDKTLVSPSLDEGADSKVREKGHETPEVGPSMQYLSLTNEERNQYTTSSITSNLALYEVGTDIHACPYQLPLYAFTRGTGSDAVVHVRTCMCVPALSIRHGTCSISAVPALSIWHGTCSISAVPALSIRHGTCSISAVV